MGWITGRPQRESNHGQPPTQPAPAAWLAHQSTPSPPAHPSGCLLASILPALPPAQCDAQLRTALRELAAQFPAPQEWAADDSATPPPARGSCPPHTNRPVFFFLATFCFGWQGWSVVFVPINIIVTIPWTGRLSKPLALEILSNMQWTWHFIPALWDTLNACQLYHQ